MAATPGPVRQRLAELGIDEFFLECQDNNTSVTGTVNSNFISSLRGDERFYEGPFHWLHPEVGHPKTEFREIKVKNRRGSLQVVVNTETSYCHVDIDKYNYQDVVNIIGHLFGEVLPSFFRRRHA